MLSNGPNRECAFGRLRNEASDAGSVSKPTSFLDLTGKIGPPTLRGLSPNGSARGPPVRRNSGIAPGFRRGRLDPALSDQIARLVSNGIEHGQVVNFALPLEPWSSGL